MYNILLIAAIFGFVLTTLIFSKRSVKPISTLFLGSFYFLLSVYALQAYIIDGGHLIKSSWFFLWPLIPYNLFAVPVYFYFTTVIDDGYTWKTTHLLWFFPFVLSLIDVGYVYMQPDPVYTKLLHGAITDPQNRLHANYWLLTLDQHMFLRHLWQLLALVFVLPKVLGFIRKNGKSKAKKLLNKWLLIFWSGLALFAIVAIFYAIGNRLGQNIFEYGAIIPLTLYIIMFLIGVIPIYFPTILQGYPKERKANSTEIQGGKTETMDKFGLQEVAVEDKLKKVIDGKLYLNPDFNMTNLARQIDIPPHQLSYFLKQQYGQNFAAFKNELRICHAKQLIREGFLGTNTMDALALECGFANRSSFSKTFKNMTSLSPSEYDHDLKNTN